MEGILQNASDQMRRKWTTEEALYGAPWLTSCINISVGRLSSSFTLLYSSGQLDVPET